MSPQYKPREPHVEAERVALDTLDKVALWCGGEHLSAHDAPGFVRVPSLEGILLAEVGDYVLRAPNNRFSVMIGEDFLARYQPVGMRSDVGGSLRRNPLVAPSGGSSGSRP